MRTPSSRVPGRSLIVTITSRPLSTTVTRHAPPFLLIHGDKDEAVPFEQSVAFQKKLRAAGVRCDLLVIPNGPHATGSWHTIPGVPDWEKQTTEWLNGVLHHKGPIGAGIRKREPK